MGQYLNSLPTEIKQYFRILSSDFPDWLEDYIITPEMLRLKGISMNCGLDYTNCFDIKYWYSNLEHSVGVALILWNFTHDKKQTLAGLFHDIATPVFKHCIDFMNGDSLRQESTEEKTGEIIRNSKQIMELLTRDNIAVEEVEDYKMYSLADNETPGLSADRFEYTFSSGLVFQRVWSLEKIKQVYENIKVGINEKKEQEFIFQSKSVCEDYVKIIAPLWHAWISPADRTCMQFIADLCKSMKNFGFLTVDDLYQLSEEELIQRIKNCPNDYIQKSFAKFQNTTSVIESIYPLDDKYSVHVEVKKRYILPLVYVNNQLLRIHHVSEGAYQEYQKLMAVNFDGYTSLDFDFQPIKPNEMTLKRTKKEE